MAAPREPSYGLRMTDEPPDDQAARLARNRHYNPDLDPNVAREPTRRPFGTLEVVEAVVFAVLTGITAATLGAFVPWPLAVLIAVVGALAISTIRLVA